jgi:hydrogenase nickel incorporation protein HypA/HybF
MHEVSIVEGVIDLIEKQKEIHKFERVIEIRIACGIYNCASDENLNFCLKTVAEGTYLETALITVKRLPERWKCSACKIDFVRENSKVDASCPKCATTDVVPLLNSEIYLDNLEVE